MKPLKDYLLKNFEVSKLEQIADDYRERGYSVKKNVQIGDYRVDLAAIKGDETIYIELKSNGETPEAKRRIKQMSDYFKTIPNSKFFVIISRYPEPKKISFENIEEILSYFFTMDCPSDLDILSTHTGIDFVHDVCISEVNINDRDIFISCNGMVCVTLQYGSDSDQEPGQIPTRMSFPFKFKGTISYIENGYDVTDCDLLEFDTDAFYK